MRRLLVLVLLLASCGKPAPPPPATPPPPAPEKKKKKEKDPPPPLHPDVAAKIDEAKRAMVEAAEKLPKDSEVRRKLMEKAGVADVPSGPPSQVVRPLPPPDPPGPRLLAAVNDSDTAEIPAGWPLVLEAVVTGDAGSSKPKVELPDGWTARPAGDSAWSMLPVELDTIPRGTYRIGLLLEGGTRHDCVVRLTPARRPKNEAEDLHRSQLLVRVHLSRGDKDAAAAEAADLVRRRGKLAGAHHLQGTVFEASGKTEEAAAARARAGELDPRGSRGPAKNDY